MTAFNYSPLFIKVAKGFVFVALLMTVYFLHYSPCSGWKLISVCYKVSQIAISFFYAANTNKWFCIVSYKYNFSNGSINILCKQELHFCNLAFCT